MRADGLPRLGRCGCCGCCGCCGSDFGAQTASRTFLQASIVTADALFLSRKRAFGVSRSPLWGVVSLLPNTPPAWRRMVLFALCFDSSRFVRDRSWQGGCDYPRDSSDRLAAWALAVDISLNFDQIFPSAAIGPSGRGNSRFLFAQWRVSKFVAWPFYFLLRHGEFLL